MNSKAQVQSYQPKPNHTHRPTHTQTCIAACIYKTVAENNNNKNTTTPNIIQQKQNHNNNKKQQRNYYCYYYIIKFYVINYIRSLKKKLRKTNKQTA